MKKIIVSAAVAMVLGVAVMFLPIVTYTNLPVTTDRQSLSGGENETFDWDLSIAPSEAASVAEEAKRAPLEKIDDAAQILGRADAGPSPFPSSLLHVIIVVATGLVAAAGVALFSRKRMRLIQSFNLQ